MESIISAIIAGGLTLVGVILTNASSNKKIEQKIVTTQAVTDTKIDQLTEAVRDIKPYGDRITKLEVKVETLEKGAC